MHRNVLVTGGAGYIGSHTCVSLLDAGYKVTVLDNYCNSCPQALDRVERIVGKKLTRIEGDVRDSAAVAFALESSGASAVIHFAGLKAVGSSAKEPLQYYDNNVLGTLRLIQAMEERSVKTLVFSSSATVYGDPRLLPIPENHPLAASNPYGRTKLMVEGMLRDTFASDKSWRFMLLRYFNPIGAHFSGMIGEAPAGVPNNLLPFIAQVALGQRDHLNIWGNDYATPDGTGVRDYIHVVDVAKGHLRALDALAGIDFGQCTAINLGTGKGHSVLEVVREFELASGRSVPYKIWARRPGDVGECYACPELAFHLLGWRAEHDLQTMCRDIWRWQSNNPLGYAN